MEFKQVAGTRRSIRLWWPWKPVEEWKIQTILEAIHQAPRVLELDLVRTVVMRPSELTDEQLRQWQTPTTTTQLEMVPILLWIFADMDALTRAMDGEALAELMQVGALNESHGWTAERVKDTILPYYQRVAESDPRIGIAGGGFSQDKDAPVYSFELLALARTAIGIAEAYALLTAVELGLGAQLSALPARFAREAMEIPSQWVSASPVFVGYGAEAPGGQRPREDLGEMISEGRFGRPFQSDRRTVERLREEGLIQEGVPSPGRRSELRRLARMFGLPE